MGRNLVICLDGTNNEPETGTTNVARIYQIAVKDTGQLVYYDPGVGTMGARGAVTPLGKFLTRVDGLVLGYGVRENIEEAYAFLMHQYQPGDQLYLFGFSRGAYTARALSGLLRTVGLLRPGADNLVPYALKLYTRDGRRGESGEATSDYWQLRQQFCDNFANPQFPHRFDHRQVAFLGAWDTVKTVGWFNLRAQFEQARWPFTRQTPNVHRVRHAIAVDEWRRPYPEYRFLPAPARRNDPDHVRQVWFAGVHSDVGGTYPDEHQLSDVALAWMVDEAVAAGLRIDAKTYRALLGADPGTPLPPERALGHIHPLGAAWRLMGRHRRPIDPADEVHPSVCYRVDALRGTDRPYNPPLP